MSRIPYRRILVVTMLLALTVVPMAGARTVKPASVGNIHGGDWLGAALRWVEDLTGLRQAGYRPSVPGVKDLELTSIKRPSGGSCIDPGGHPNPLCGGV